jgi:hypothetical protein
MFLVDVAWVSENKRHHHYITEKRQHQMSCARVYKEMVFCGDFTIFDRRLDICCREREERGRELSENGYEGCCTNIDYMC